VQQVTVLARKRQPAACGSSADAGNAFRQLLCLVIGSRCCSIAVPALPMEARPGFSGIQTPVSLRGVLQDGDNIVGKGTPLLGAKAAG
jgi:hypothetical protein